MGLYKVTTDEGDEFTTTDLDEVGEKLTEWKRDEDKSGVDFETIRHDDQ